MFIILHCAFSGILRFLCTIYLDIPYYLLILSSMLDSACQIIDS